MDQRSGSRVRDSLRIEVPRRTFLGMAGLSAAGLLGARAALAGQGPTAAPMGQESGALAASAIDDLAFALDYDTERIFRFVADEIWYEPYGGILRGVAGTLESRAGNSADKALLLAALLGASLVPTRFVVGTLDDDAADELWMSTQADTATVQERAAQVITQSDPSGFAAPVTAPRPRGPLPSGSPEGQEVVASLSADHGPLIQAVEGRIRTGVGDVLAALKGHGISIPAARSGLPALERERHVWLQAHQGSGWVDLDPSRPGAVQGEVLGSAVESALVTLPDDLRHRVETRVIVERTLGTGLEQVVLLEHVGFADAMQGLPICLLHDTPEGLKSIGVAIGNALEGTSQYQPILMVGDTAHVGFIGLRFTTAEDDGAVSVFGGVTDGVATAEWLESTTASPDGRVSTARRVLFDRIGATARGAATYDTAALAELPLIRAEADGPGEYAAMQALHFLAIATGATTAEALARVDPADESPWALSAGPYLYHLARDAANATAGVGQGSRIFHDAPNVTRWSAEVTPGVWDGSFTTGIDVLHRSFDSVPIVGVSTAEAPGVLAGVASHVAERVAMGGVGATADPTDDVSVGAVFDVAAAQGIETRVIAPGDAIDDFPWSADARRVLQESLTAGLIAIAPERPVSLLGAERVGWWLFDPSTGALTDQMDDGRGVAMVERAFLHIANFLAKRPYVKLGVCVAITLWEAYEILHVAHEASSGGSEAGLAKALGVALATGGAAHRLHGIACH